MLGNRQMTQRIHPAVFSKLVAVLGGTTTRIPVRAETLVKRVPSLTLIEAEHVVALAADVPLYIQKHELITAKHSRVRALATAGVTVRNIALELGYTDANVRKILKGSIA